MHLTIDQMSEGKTCHGKLQCGRATRHKDVRLCVVGGIAICMMNQEFMTQEFGCMCVKDWLDNSTWFRLEFPVDSNSSNRTVEMSSDSHRDHTKATLT